MATTIKKLEDLKYKTINFASLIISRESREMKFLNPVSRETENTREIPNPTLKGRKKFDNNVISFTLFYLKHKPINSEFKPTHRGVKYVRTGT